MVVSVATDDEEATARVRKRGRVTNSTSINNTTESNHTGHRDRRGDLGDSMLVNSMHGTDGSVAPGFSREPINTLPPGTYL
jgi:hypothetical protein